jgi:hypothetical protein
MQTLHTIEEIKHAVDSGKTVKCENGQHNVIRDSVGQYLIMFGHSDYYIGLHSNNGRLNARNFYIP